MSKNISLPVPKYFFSFPPERRNSWVETVQSGYIRDWTLVPQVPIYCRVRFRTGEMPVKLFSTLPCLGNHEEMSEVSWAQHSVEGTTSIKTLWIDGLFPAGYDLEWNLEGKNTAIFFRNVFEVKTCRLIGLSSGDALFWQPANILDFCKLNRSEDLKDSWNPLLRHLARNFCFSPHPSILWRRKKKGNQHRPVYGMKCKVILPSPWTESAS